jgi:hypothetical protein
LEAVTERLLVAPRVVAAGVGRLVAGCLDVERALRFFSIAPFLVVSLDLVVDLVFAFGAIVLIAFLVKLLDKCLWWWAVKAKSFDRNDRE